MDIFSKLKRLVSEPKVYALMVESARGQVLHLGVHFSLEEAYSAARARMEMLTPHNPGEAMDIDLWNTIPARQVIAQLMDPAKIEELTKLPEGTSEDPIDHVVMSSEKGGPAPMIVASGTFPPLLEALLKKQGGVIKPGQKAEPTLTDQIQDMKTTKNDLMKKLIKDGDIAQVEKLKSLLGPYSRRYVLKAIEKKNKL